MEENINIKRYKWKSFEGDSSLWLSPLTNSVFWHQLTLPYQVSTSESPLTSCYLYPPNHEDFEPHSSYVCSLLSCSYYLCWDSCHFSSCLLVSCPFSIFSSIHDFNQCQNDPKMHIGVVFLLWNLQWCHSMAKSPSVLSWVSTLQLQLIWEPLYTLDSPIQQCLS